MATSPEELTAIATRHQFFVERYKGAEVKKFEKFLLQMAGIVRTKIGDKNLSDYSLARLKKLNDEIDSALVAVYKDYEAVWREGVLDFGVYESQFEVKSLAQVIDYDFALPSASQVEAAVFTNPMAVQGTYNGFFLGGTIADLKQKTVKRITAAINVGAIRGQTTPEIIRSIIGTKKAGYADGVLGMSYKDADFLVRTGLQHTAAMARQRTWRQNSDIVRGWKYRAVFDSRTTQQCRALGQLDETYPIGQGPMPPIHGRCRSTMAAALDARFSFLQEDATRSSRGEQGVEPVSADLGSYDWLKTQPKAFQDAALGSPTLGKLFRDGGLSPNQFAELTIGPGARPLSIKEMRETDPAAFAKAGL
jgi:hypothetical protein